MKTVLAGILTLFVISTAMATSASAQTVRWRQVVGVTTAQNVDNPVCATDQQGNCIGNIIHSGTFAWTTRSGSATVNLATGAASFHVEGLVINGTVFSGTAGPITQVAGTLVCNLGGTMEAILDTPPVNLSLQGDASFNGRLTGISGNCANPLFLIRIVNPSVALGRWIATGAGRTTTGPSSFFDGDEN